MLASKVQRQALYLLRGLVGIARHGRCIRQTLDLSLLAFENIGGLLSLLWAAANLPHAKIQALRFSARTAEASAARQRAMSKALNWPCLAKFKAGAKELTLPAAHARRYSPQKV